MSYQCPLGTGTPIKKSKYERNVTVADVKGATLLYENEYYKVYSNGLLVKTGFERSQDLTQQEQAV